MTSGNSLLSRGWFLAIAMILIASVARAHAEDNLHAVMDSLHAVTLASGTFVEKKYLRILNEPLESSGQLVYKAPDRLEKMTTRPDRQSLVVVGDELTVANGISGQQKLKLAEHPDIRAFVESMRATLSGNVDALRQYYDVFLVGNVAQWTLELRPTAKDMKDIVKQITLRGGNGHLQSVAIDEADGDHSVMIITPSEP
jgi:outer membrane lipoprotein-sorting protein